MNQQNAALANNLQTTVSPQAATIQHGVKRVKVEKPYSELHLTLRVPQSFNGNEIKEIKFREVTLADLMIVHEEGETPEAMSKVFSRMSGGIDPSVFMNLPMREYGVIQDFFISCNKDLKKED